MNIDKILMFVIMAIVQGLTEPLPISSSGHLVLLKHYFDLVSDNVILEIMLHLGSLVAVIVFYFNDIKTLILNNLTFIFRRDESKRSDFELAIKLVIATIPAAIIGFTFREAITLTTNNVRYVGWFYLITTSVLLLPKLIKPSTTKLGKTQAVIIGFAQAMALLPGVSRSGSTIATSMFLGVKPAEGVKFSFFMFIPIAFIVIASGTFDLIQSSPSTELLVAYGIAILVSFFVTYFAMSWLSLIINKNKYHYFAGYTFLLSLIILFFL